MKKPRLIEELVTLQVTRRRRYAVADSSPPAAPFTTYDTTAEELTEPRPGIRKAGPVAPVVQLAARRRAG